ncbi:MAG: carboxypeptidase-like regulatory domain-containing protein, partial [Bacteroidetes bacterium]|nr:carboxypeptidase-like regulatory domain-containing protein [Bacteroidota bacterium]
MEPRITFFRRKGLGLFFLVFLALLLLSPLSTSAQKNGSITGRISDISSGEYLPGANVRLDGTTYGAATDRSGIYRISNIPPGTYTLIASYIGYDDASIEVTIG